MTTKVVPAADVGIESGAAPDPFDLANLVVPQDYVSGVVKVLEVTVRKPRSQEFFRTHPDPEYRRNLFCFDSQADGKTYVVPPQFVPLMMREAVQKTVYTIITMQETLILWPVPTPTDGRSNDYWDSAHRAAEKGKKGWVKIKADPGLGAYQIYDAEDPTLPDPVLPKETFQELIRVGFRDRLIDSADHPIIRKLHGRS
jgi:hypothetical protein